MNGFGYNDTRIVEWINSCVSLLLSFDASINISKLDSVLSVFVHRSLRNFPSNERLEFFGDSAIKAISTAFAMSLILGSVSPVVEVVSPKRKRRIHYEEKLNEIRVRLIGNDVMKSICLRFGWYVCLAYDSRSVSFADQSKMASDLIECIIGFLWLECGPYKAIEAFLWMHCSMVGECLDEESNNHPDRLTCLFCKLSSSYNIPQDPNHLTIQPILMLCPLHPPQSLSDLPNYCLFEDEAFEFIGDAILEISITIYIFQHKHGVVYDMHRQRNLIVSDRNLISVGKDIDELLKPETIRDLRKNQESGPAIAKAMESMIGQKFCDFGLDAASKFCWHLLKLDSAINTEEQL